jgi:predicted ATPase/DNA-binding SARP family transcriptional activator
VAPGRLELTLLGRFAVSVDGVEAPDRAWRLRKARTLVKALALEPGRRLHRERAMELLWPDLTATAAQNNLHQALHAARRVLGPDSIVLADGMLELAPAATCDVDVFEEAARAAREHGTPDAYGTALDAYGGELLPEDAYESWSEARRAALGDLHCALCLELAELQEPADAIATLQRALAAAPLHEPAHRALMRTYERLGRRQDALAQFHRLRGALRRTFEAEPDAETRALYRDLLAADPVEDETARAVLPSPMTSFVGRGREVRDVVELVGRSRLVTLIGPGGSGKTRLAIAALDTVRNVDGDVYFVELAAISDDELVAEAAATAIGIRVPSRRTAAEVVAEQLASQRALLVLDTCEHVVDASAALADTVLRACPQVTVVATSREPLRCEGETTWRVPGLAPDEAVELFAARARDAVPDFVVDADVEALCDKLEGMPLAIELAAARVTSLSPAQIAARLDDSLDVLATGRRTALARQQTLRATIEWSHDLLSGEERVLFRRLAVFAGSFSLDAAAVVCAGGAIEERRILELVGRLVDKSLVTVEDAGAARYRLLDTVRQFAEERLESAGERETVEARHRDWAQTLVEPTPPLDELERDHDNIRAALDSGLRSDPQGALRLAAGVWRFWLDRNYFTEGVRRLRAVLDAAPERTELRATTLLAAGSLELRCGEVHSFVERGREAESLVEGARPDFAADVVHRAGLFYLAGTGFDDSGGANRRALAIAREQDRAVRASILHASALAPYYLGDLDEARRLLESTIATLATVAIDEPPFFEGVTFGFTVLPEGPGGRLRPILEETILLFHRFGRAQAEAYALANLGLLERSAGRRDAARAALDESLARFRRLRDERGEALALAALGNHLRTFGEPDEAVARLEQSLGLRRRHGDRRAVGMTEIDLALALARRGDLGEARELFAAVHDRFRAADDAPGQGGALVDWAVAEEQVGDTARALELLVAGAEVWELNLGGQLPGWAWFAAGDAFHAAGEREPVDRCLDRAERLFSRVADARGVELCRMHAGRAKPAQSGLKAPPS